MNSTSIQKVHVRRIWDSRGQPTVDVEVTVREGWTGCSIAPAGASTRSGEAIDRRDGGERLGGWDVRGGGTSLNDEIAPCLLGMEVDDQQAVDAALMRLDGQSNKGRLAGNAIVATSMAVAHAAAGLGSLWRHLRPEGELHLSLPEIQVFGGGGPLPYPKTFPCGRSR